MAYHPQTDGQSKRTIWTLEDMLRASVLQFGDDCHAKLDLMEFAYNNSYHSSIGMAPFEALYGSALKVNLWKKPFRTMNGCIDESYTSNGEDTN